MKLETETGFCVFGQKRN